jgi:NADH-quinone oxidoreductase subunit L
MLFAGTCAFGQDDIKRVLAYSTISQLGYMFMAAGMRAYSIALFMLAAHAFYKALMFLGAGSVMHGMHEETDMKRMGGLIRRMPVTGVTFIVGALALSGIFPLSGFFAKDEILEVANSTGRPWMYVLGSVGALLSALYMGRLVFLTFFGRPRSEEAEHAHESSPVMTVPLVVLAVGAAVVGLLDTSTDGLISRFVAPVVGLVPEGAAGIAKSALVALSLSLAVGGLLITWVVYASGKIDWLALRVRLQPGQRVLEHGWYVDNYYSALLVTPGKAVAAWLAYVFDTRIVDGIVNGIGASVRALARSGRRLQTGLVRTYALAFLAGAIGLLVYVGFRS